jgi:hypothetical protein
MREALTPGANQAGGGAAHNADTSPDGVGSDAQRDDRIEALPACEGPGAHAGDDAEGGPGIGEQVLGIGFKSNGVALLLHVAAERLRSAHRTLAPSGILMSNSGNWGPR